MTIDRMVASSGAINQALEERFLFMLLLLRQPRLKLIYVTSMPVDPAIIEYYLSLLPGIIPSHARARLSMFSVGDSSASPLTEKLLARPRLIGELRRPDPRRHVLAPVSVQHDDQGAGPRCCSASPCTARTRATSPRDEDRLARGVRRCGRLVPDGRQRCSVARRRGVHRDAGGAPRATAAMVKLNEGVAGAGNAEVDLTGLPPAGDEGGSGVRGSASSA